MPNFVLRLLVDKGQGLRSRILFYTSLVLSSNDVELRVKSSIHEVYIIIPSRDSNLESKCQSLLELKLGDLDHSAITAGCGLPL